MCKHIKRLCKNIRNNNDNIYVNMIKVYVNIYKIYVNLTRTRIAVYASFLFFGVIYRPSEFALILGLF